MPCMSHSHEPIRGGALSLIRRPSTCIPIVFDHLQYAKMEEEGLGNFIM